MRGDTVVKLKLDKIVSALLVLLGAVAAAPTDMLAGEAKVQRLIFVSAGFNESNRFWTITRPFQLQFDPFLETLLDLDPKTGEYSPAWLRSGNPAPTRRNGRLSCARAFPSTSGMGSSPPRMSSTPTPS